MCCTKKSSHKDRGARPLIVSNRLAQPVEALVLDAAVDEDKRFNLGMLFAWSDLSFGSSRVSLKTCFLKTKICCVRAPDHTTAVDYSFNTSGCGFTKMLVKFQQEIVYTLAFKATKTANDSD